MQCNYYTLHMLYASPNHAFISLPVSRLLERVFDHIVLSQIHLPLLLCDRVLHEYFLYMLSHELSDVPWVPKLAGHTQVFAAAS